MVRCVIFFKAKDEGRPGAGGSAMLVRVDAVDALTLICASDASSTADATSFIAAVDPPSAGVPLRQVKRVSTC